MWVAHLALFRERTLIAWFGLTIVVSNIVSSLFHTHIVDTGQGWLYVFGVGMLGEPCSDKSRRIILEAIDTGSSARTDRFVLTLASHQGGAKNTRASENANLNAHRSAHEETYLSNTLRS